MIEIIAKRIQTRLSKSGFKFSLKDIRETCNELISDLSNPTDDEVNSVIQHLKDKAPSQLAISNSVSITSVSGTAHQMGIVLNASEVAEIANNINASSSTFDSDIDAIKSAITAFVLHKSAQSQAKISQMIEDVKDIVSQEARANSEYLADGISSINEEIKQAESDLKSSVARALSAFSIAGIQGNQTK